MKYFKVKILIDNFEFILTFKNKPLTVSISSSESITGNGFSVSALSGMFSSIHFSGSSSGSAPTPCNKTEKIFLITLYIREGDT